MFCKRKKQPNTLADLWTADIIKLSFTWICDISHRASSPSRSSNCFCLSHLPLIALRNCNVCGSRCENTCWPAITHRGTTETFLFFFFIGWSQSVNRDFAIWRLWCPFQMRLKAANRKDRHSGTCVTQGLGELAGSQNHSFGSMLRVGIYSS